MSAPHILRSCVAGFYGGKMKRSRTVCIIAVSIILALTVAVNVLSGVFYKFIDGWLIPAEVDAETRAAGKELALEIERGGAVLTKNEGGALPISVGGGKNVNVFGWAATEWIRSGDGSGRSGTTRSSIVYDFLAGLKECGINYNEDLIAAYKNFRSKDREYAQKGSLGSTNEQFSRLYEPSINDKSIFGDNLLAAAKSYSDTAFVVLGRVTGESNDCPMAQYKQVTKDGDIVVDETRTYLDASTEELELLTYIGQNYDNVIVIINSTNVMNLSFMDSVEGLDACLIAGGTGAYGALGLAEVISGKISPSGRTADTYAYDFKTSPAFVTSGQEGLGAYTNGAGLYPTTVTDTSEPIGKFPQVSYCDYLEDIYVGYKWYETADAEGFWNDKGGYRSVIQYPFGYGLSYTTFEKEVVDVSPAAGSTITADDTITIKVKVTNTGDVAGSEVVQLYYDPPYTKGGIEKSAVNLGAFAKTVTLKPGENQTLTLTLKANDMASYDCYDKNSNGFTGYELEKGTYSLTLRKNSHDLEDVKSGKNTFDYKVNSDILIDKDPVSGAKVENRFTGANTVDGVAVDGGDSGANIKYLSRANFKETFSSVKPSDRAMTDNVKALNVWTKERMEADLKKNTSGKTVTVGATAGVKVYENGEVTGEGLLLGMDYENPLWDVLLDQMTVDEMKNLTLHGYMGTRAVPSIGMPETTASDGCAHMGSWGSVVNRPDDPNTGTTPFPQPSVLAQTWDSQLAYSFGLAMGNEARQKGVDCWYGPGINLHRTPFGGRNYEYWSEDALISGVMCANAVKGAKNAGVYSTIKHLALYNTDSYRDGQYVWLTEQNLRENYLKAFRLAVQEGGATGLMTSYNRIGAVWTGASSALQMSVIREEFGFKGFIITDYADHYELMTGDASLRNGGDLWMDGFSNSGSYNNNYLDAQSTNNFNERLREASKNIIYAYLNAAYTNEMYKASGADDVIVVERGAKGTSWWIFALIGFDAVAVIGCAAWVVIVFFVRKTNEKSA